MSPDKYTIKLQRINSTNDYLKEIPEIWDINYFTVQAHEQTGGRGRYSRKWYSSPGMDLTFSFIYLPPVSVSDISPITVLAGLAVYRTLQRICGKGLHLKWPNDIYYEEKKIGGILCEQIIDKKNVIIVGIGININSTDFPAEINENTASLKTITGRDYIVEEILDSLMEDIKTVLNNFSIPLPETLIQEWIDATRSIGKSVTFYNENKKLSGTITGIGDDGSLIIRESAHGTIISHRDEIMYQDTLKA